MLTINIVTLFPELIQPHLEFLPFKRAILKSLIKVNLVNLRDFAIDKRGTVDDKPYGGGVGMLLRIEPLHDALKSIAPTKNIALLTPTGKKFTQDQAKHFATQTELTLICGRYEGADARIEHYVTDKISIGDYVLSGGELPALVIMESIVRLIPGAIEKEAAVLDESFSEDELLEYPQYTRPEIYEGLKVPEVLLSGHHKDIENWRKAHKAGVSAAGSSSVGNSSAEGTSVATEGTDKVLES